MAKTKVEEQEVERTKLLLHIDCLQRSLDHEGRGRTLPDRFEALERQAAAQPHTCARARAPGNMSKNRYPDILPYDHTLVALSSSDPAMPGYINASHVRVEDGRAFIATQGPLSTTRHAFWQMVWEQNVHIIVMLTREKEGGRNKCVQYWPSAPAPPAAAGLLSPGRPDSGAFQFGGLLVAHVATEVRPSHVERCVVLKLGKECRRITHLQFTEWPDQSTPDPRALLVFLRAFRSLAAAAPAGPVVVHCSAGVGRTGTFIAMDALVAASEEGGLERLDPAAVVLALRQCRVKMVQTKEQFVFLYHCIKAYLEARLDEVDTRLGELKSDDANASCSQPKRKRKNHDTDSQA